MITSEDASGAAAATKVYKSIVLELIPIFTLQPADYIALPVRSLNLPLFSAFYQLMIEMSC